jgi:hypothetical protein
MAPTKPICKNKMHLQLLSFSFIKPHFIKQLLFFSGYLNNLRFKNQILPQRNLKTLFDIARLI